MRWITKGRRRALCDRAALAHGINNIDARFAIYVFAAGALSRIEQVIAANDAGEVFHTLIDGAAVE